MNEEDLLAEALVSCCCRCFPAEHHLLVECRCGYHDESDEVRDGTRDDHAQSSDEEYAPERQRYLPYEEAEDFLSALQAYPHIRVRGFMCVATHTEDMDLVAQEFDQMHTLYEKMRSLYPAIDTLSMGMSHDYKIAIEHGANMVRIGTAIFE